MGFDVHVCLDVLNERKGQKSSPFWGEGEFYVSGGETWSDR